MMLSIIEFGKITADIDSTLKFLSYKHLLRNDMCNHCDLWLTISLVILKLMAFPGGAIPVNALKDFERAVFSESEIKTFCSSNDPVSISDWCK